MPQRPREHQLEEESNRAFESSLPSRWVARRIHPDYGLDYSVEIFNAANKATGLSFYAQLKATDEADLAKAFGSVRFTRETADYYRAQRLPVLIVRYHASSRQLFGRWFHAYNPHLARRGAGTSDAKSMRFQFYEQDVFTDETPAALEAGVSGFLKFRSPELALPLRVSVTSTDGTDVYPPIFALRRLLGPVSDLVTFEVRQPGADDPSITLARDQAVVSLADVASVTLDHERPQQNEPDSYAADVALALAVALAYVGQANIASQIAFALAARSTVVADPEVSMTVAGAMFRSRRIAETIKLADALDSSDEEEIRTAAFAFLTVLMARGDRLKEDERALALSMSEHRLERRLQRGDQSGAASEAYSLAMLKKRLRDAPGSIDAFRRAAQLDARYLSRAYYHADFAGVLFENDDHEEAAEHYGRAVSLGEGALTVALHADALLFSGRYEESLRIFDEYLREDRGPDGAEWRLKRRILPLLIQTVGATQVRKPDAAVELLSPWDFEKGPDMPTEEAWRLCNEAVALDACLGEAWFRLALLAVMATERPADGREFGIAGAVLRRTGVAAWANAVLYCDPNDEITISDLLYAGYRFLGDEFVQKVSQTVQGAPHFVDAAGRVVELLDDAVVKVETERQTRGFTMRFEGEDGEMHEIVFGPGEEVDPSVPARPTNVTWRPVSSQPRPFGHQQRSPRRKRPGKTHGKNKKRKRGR